MVTIGTKGLLSETTPESQFGGASVVLVWVVGAILFAAAFLEHRGRSRAASVAIGLLAFAAGPTFGFVYADAAAAAVGPLIGFALLLPMLPRGRATVMVAISAVLCRPSIGACSSASLGQQGRDRDHRAFAH